MDDNELNPDPKLLKEFESMKEKEMFIKNMLKTAGPGALRMMVKELGSIPMDVWAGLKVN